MIQGIFFIILLLRCNHGHDLDHNLDHDLGHGHALDLDLDLNLDLDLGHGHDLDHVLDHDHGLHSHHDDQMSAQVGRRRRTNSQSQPSTN